MNYIKKFLAITLIFVMQFQSVHASVAVGAWSLGNPVVNGATTTWEAVKNGARSTVAISPSSAQVVKSMLRGGLVGLALSAVTQVLEDGVDYLLDSANQELRYTPKPVYQYNPSRYYPSVPGCESSTVTFKTLEEAMSWGRYCINWSIENNHQIQKILKTTYNSITYLNVYNTEETMTVREEKNSSQRKSIPLTTLATQIINLAEQGNPEAKAYITSVVQDMLEHDEEYRKSLEAQLDAKLQEAQTNTPNDRCPPNAIRNKNGDCWICSEASRKPIKARVDKAKEQTNNLAGCKGNMSKSDLQLRFDAYSEFISAREAENQCWLPPDAGHVQSVNEMKKTVKQCEKLINRLNK